MRLERKSELRPVPEDTPDQDVGPCQPSPSQCRGDLQEDDRDDRHLDDQRNARDRSVEERPAPDIGVDQHHDHEDPHRADRIENRDRARSKTPMTRVRTIPRWRVPSPRSGISRPIGALLLLQLPEGRNGFANSTHWFPDRKSRVPGRGRKRLSAMAPACNGTHCRSDNSPAPTPRRTGARRDAPRATCTIASTAPAATTGWRPMNEASHPSASAPNAGTPHESTTNRLITRARIARIDRVLHQGLRSDAAKQHEEADRHHETGGEPNETGDRKQGKRDTPNIMRLSVTRLVNPSVFHAMREPEARYQPAQTRPRTSKSRDPRGHARIPGRQSRAKAP